MLSNPLQRFSPYQNLPPSGLISHNHVSQNSMHHHNRSMDSLNPGSQYNMPQLHHHSLGVSNHQLVRPGSQPKQRQHSYPASTRAGGSAGQVRRRISRACDQCNQLRTKCDGQHPCAHCVEFGLGCEYARERKKRGKASRKDLAAQAAARAAAESSLGQKPEGSTSTGSHGTPTLDQRANPSGLDPEDPQQERQSAMNDASHGMTDSPLQQDPTRDIDNRAHVGIDGDHMNGAPSMDMNGFPNMAQDYDRSDLGGSVMDGRPYGPSQGHGMSTYPELHYSMPAQSPTNYQANGGFRIGNSPMPGYGMPTGATPPAWGLSFSSPPAGQFGTSVPQPTFDQAKQNPPNLRYPVLEPLLPHLGSMIPVSLACDLIDLYFSSSSSAQMHPMSPYVLGFVFRKRAFLHPTKPRRCQPALLASMLWVAAQTSDASFLTSVPSARSKTCQKLLELTVGLLNPLIHTASGHPSPRASPVTDGVALGGLGVALPGSISMDALTGETGAFGAAGNLDDVITYIHLATVVSASEYKGASLRWWNAAWSLARELKLGRELPQGAQPLKHDMKDLEGDMDEHDIHRNNSNFVTEEEREERRRIWWLVYIVDRHLALCYNRPLFLLDIECDGLQQPLDDTAWQKGEFGSFGTSNTDPSILNTIPEGARIGSNPMQRRGPSFECRGHGIFGYFLPLMTILGEIVDLHHARNHPRFGVGFRSAGEWDDQAAEITRHLEAYEKSIRRFEQRYLPQNSDEKGDGSGFENGEHPEAAGNASTPSVHSVHTTTSARLTESDIQTRIVMAYGTHVMHVLHILLSGKWDPINLIDDEDLWISTQGFIAATGHAVSAAEAISQILEYDPGLEFMPFFFGIYLLQGSFLLLLIADKLQVEASPSVVRACETIVRAHEACVVTLNTEYQRNFSKVMRSALAQVRGRVPEDLNEQHQRRRELLALYRWTGDGTGLAL